MSSSIIKLIDKCEKCCVFPTYYIAPEKRAIVIDRPQKFVIENLCNIEISLSLTKSHPYGGNLDEYGGNINYALFEINIDQNNIFQLSLVFQIYNKSNVCTKSIKACSELIINSNNILIPYFDKPIIDTFENLKFDIEKIYDNKYILSVYYGIRTTKDIGEQYTKKDIYIRLKGEYLPTNSGTIQIRAL